MAYEYATVDIETTGLNRYKDKITWIGVGLAKDLESDLAKTLIYDGSNPKDMRRFRKLCTKLKEHRVKVIFQNGKFDTLFIEHHEGV